MDLNSKINPTDLTIKKAVKASRLFEMKGSGGAKGKPQQPSLFSFFTKNSAATQPITTQVAAPSSPAAALPPAASAKFASVAKSASPVAKTAQSVVRKINRSFYLIFFITHCLIMPYRIPNQIRRLLQRMKASQTMTRMDHLNLVASERLHPKTSVHISQSLLIFALYLLLFYSGESDAKVSQEAQAADQDCYCW